ncbi:hypothetical protein ACP4OV_016103 [Aristida adscensionis]
MAAGGGGEARGCGGGAAYYTTDEALSRVGFGRLQALLLGVLGGGWLAQAMEVMMLSFVGPSVREEWGVSGWAEGLVTSAVFAGMLVGACAGGLASDRHGRRVAFLFTALVTGISGLLCAFSPNYASLLALRFIVGVGLGAGHVLPTWFLEFVPAENRGFWAAVFWSFWSTGTVLEALLAWAVLPILGWRWLLAFSSSPNFIVLICFGLLPESPRYLCSRGKTSDAVLVLERISKINRKALPPGILASSDLKRRVDNNHDASVTTSLPMMEEESLRTDEDTSFRSNDFNAFQALWSRDLIRSTLLIWLVNITTYFAYYGMVLLTSELSNKSSCASVGEHPMQPKDSSVYINVLMISFAEFPGYLLAGLLADKVGRRMSMSGLFLLTCASLAPLAVHFRGGLAITLMFCARSCIQGSFSIMHAYAPEVYPTICRNTGVGVATFMGRIGSIVAPLLTTALLESCHQKEAVILLVLLLFVAGVACAFFPLETKGLAML